MGVPINTLIHIFIIFFLISCAKFLEAKTCNKLSSCSCKMDHGGTLDLSALSSSDPSNPFFQDQQGPSASDVFSWNPCQPFTEGDCKDVAVCNIHINIPNAVYFPIGTDDSAKFDFNTDGNLELSYSYEKKGVLRTAHIALICDTSQGTLKVLGEKPDPGSGNYYFELHSKTACTGTKGGGSSSGLSVGSILLIISFTVLFVYIVGGVLFNVFYWKQSGKNVFPNVGCWSTSAQLIRDGVLFTVRRGKSTKYDSI